MNKLFLVIKREYLERVRTKWFLIGTLLGPLFMAGLILAPLLVQKINTVNRTIVLVDAINDAKVVETIKSRLTTKSGSNKIDIKPQTVSDLTKLPELEKELTKQVKDKTISGYLLMKSEKVADKEEYTLDYLSDNVSDIEVMRKLEDAASAALVARRLGQAGLDATKVAELSSPIELKVKKLLEEGNTKEERGESTILALVMMFMIYMTVVLYGAAVLRGVIEEKQSRIVEVIISSISPLELMFGKLIGIGLVGLTQFAVWATFAFVLPLAFSAMSIMANRSLPDIPKSLLVYFVIYFILGYFLYATLYAMVGSMASSEQDTNSVQMPVTMLLILSTVFSSVVINDPNGTPATVLSMIPFFGPVLMFMRITIQSPPFWQIALSITLMLVTIFICAWLAGKIYRVGILMYGKRPTLPEVIKWLKYT